MVGNIASNYGGGISVQDGILTLRARMGSTTSHHIPDSYEYMSLAPSSCSRAKFGMLSFAKHPLFRTLALPWMDSMPVKLHVSRIL